MRLRRRLTGLTILLLLLLALPASAQDDPENPLLNLLRYVPDTESNREFITYGDLALWNQSWGFIRISSVAQLELRSDLSDPVVPATLFTMVDQTRAPLALGLDRLLVDEMRSYLGFDFFTTDRFIEAGNLPEVLTVIQTSVDNASIARALTRAEYAESTVASATLYSKGDDNEMNLAADMPRTAQLGNLNRVALMDDVVLMGRATAVVEGGVDAATGSTPSLMDNAAFRAGALAVSDPEHAGDGHLVGAFFMGQDEPLDWMRVLGQYATPQQIEAARATLAGTGTLPAYELAVFGTRRRADDSQLLLALVFPEGVDAQAATDTLMMRMKLANSQRRQQPLVEMWAEYGVEIEWGRGVEIDGVPVALVSLSARNPTLREVDGRIETRVFNWASMVYLLDLSFMIPA